LLLRALRVARTKAPIQPAVRSPAAAAQSADQQLTTLVEAYWDKYLELNPLQATLNGDYRFNNRLENNISPSTSRSRANWKAST